MGIVQGTFIKLKIIVTDPDTNAPKDPSDVQVFVKRPSSSTTLLYSQGTVAKLNPGIYQAVIDTTVEAGPYTYEVKASGGDAVVMQRTITILPKLGP